MKSSSVNLNSTHKEVNCLQDASCFEKYSVVHYEYNREETTAYETKTLCQLFEDRVSLAPNHIAIEYKDRVLTFKELNELANQLARYITKQYQAVTQKDLPSETMIPISVGRSAEYVIGILAILKAGAAYVPINPEYPPSRIEYILNDINSKLILTESYSVEKFNQYAVKPILFDEQLFLYEAKENLNKQINPNDLAYVIYTSGSSGAPKGVLAQHVNVISQVICANYFHADASDTMAFFSDVSFDSTTFEVWGALLNGAKLFIPDNFFDLLSNPTLFKQTVKEKNITILLLTRALFDLLYTLDETVFAPLKCLLVGGEALTKNIMLSLLQSDYRPKHLINAYGPTENSTFCTTYELHDDFSQLNSVPIGRPYSNRVGFILDNHLQLMPIGVVGEIHVSGPSLSKGYLNKPELTEERFIPNCYFKECNEKYPRIYKTSDLVKWLPDGNIEYAGRNDFQVKLRGYRIELAEIETRMLELPDIKHSVVVLNKNDNLSYLVGYYVAEKPLEEQILRNHLAALVPDYMIPSVFMYLETLPVTTNGKLDRRALPQPEYKGVEIKPASQTTNNAVSVEQTISQIWSKTLNLSHFGRSESFFNLGGNSLAAMMVRKELEDVFKITLNIVELFQHTTLAQLSERITELMQAAGVTINEAASQTTSNDFSVTCNEPIAIVGMACRLPGARDPEAFWNLICNEQTNLRDFTVEELRNYGVSDALIADERYVKRGATFDEPFHFDAGFFGYSVKDAELMDPQQRQFLECAWEALEFSGNVPEKYQGDIGVFATQGRNDYFMNHVYTSELAQANMFQAILANEKDFLSTKVSYKLNLTGPSITLQTACSSSLVSVQMACESLKMHSCDMALAGGVSLFYNHGYGYEDDLIESPDGYCRAFDSKAKGTVVTSGVGVVVLKRLSDAIAQQDTIYAVIKGGALNNDGSSKMAFTAPSVQGQSAVIEKALRNANVSPDTITYIEAHGTGTMLGDPIEWTALHNVYKKHTNKKEYCTIGSVKTNIGHTDSAAGVFGLIKTTLALKHNILPATLNFTTLNPEIESFNQLFRVSNKTSTWDNQGKLKRAALSSFGLGGTNAHVILEEYQEPNVSEEREPSYHLIPISAKNRESLFSMATKVKHYIESEEKVHVANLAFTAQHGRAEFKERGYFIVKEKSAQSKLHISSSYLHEGESQERPSILLKLSDNLATPLNDLYDHYPLFKEAFDECAKSIEQKSGIKISLNRENNEAKWMSFALQYALAQLFISLVNVPDDIMAQGHGMYVASVIKGRLTLQDAVVALLSGSHEKEIQQPFVAKETELSANILFVTMDHEVQPKENTISMIPQANQDAQLVFLQLIGRLWSHGVSVDWDKLGMAQTNAKKIRIPTYCFTKKHYEIQKNAPKVDVPQESTSLESQLKGIWSKVLGVSTEELTDSSHFLELGGDSLAFIDLLKHIKTTLHLNLNLEELINSNELGSMLTYLNSKMV